MPVIIEEVSGKKGIHEFVTFPFRLYKDSPYWVPPLIFDEVSTLNPKKNPAFEFCEAKLWMAYKNGETVGRVAGIINHKANEVWNSQSARFGWLDFTDEEEVSAALFKTVEDWARSKGMNSIHGPLGFTDMDKEGMLVEGFNELGTIATYYNHPYYSVHTEKAGYTKDADWVEYEFKNTGIIPEKFGRIGQLALERYNLRIANFTRKKDLLKYAPQIFEVLNEAYKDLYGFVPLTPKQIDYYIKMYFSFIKVEFISLILDKEDKVAAFGITMPSMSKAIQKAKGRLFPFGFVHMLKAMYNNDTVDFYLTAVRPDLQGKGVNALLFLDLIPKYTAFGITKAESNVELENNQMVQRQWELFEKRQHKRRRAYVKNL